MVQLLVAQLLQENQPVEVPVVPKWGQKPDLTGPETSTHVSKKALKSVKNIITKAIHPFKKLHQVSVSSNASDGLGGISFF
jgi:hypothetical protein